MDLALGILTIAKTVLTFLVIITVLVAVHELGHFWLARLFGMDVNAFAVMMGGIRKTDLRPHLKKPLEPVGLVWVAAAASLGIFLAGVGTNNSSLEALGLGLLAIPVPIWIAVRISRLYHFTPDLVFSRLGMAYGGGILLLLLGSRGQGINMPLLLGVLLASGIVGCLLIYYAPMLGKPEDSQMGESQIQVEEKDEEPGMPPRRVWIPIQFRPIFHVTDKRGTEFSFLALPLGGFAAIKGMHAKEDGSEVSIPRGFYSKPAWQRFIVLFAGPLFSIGFGVALLALAFSAFGIPDPDGTTIIKVVEKGTPADAAGIKPGDKVLSVNGKPTENFMEMLKIVRAQKTEAKDGPVGIPTTFEIERGAQRLTLVITPKISEKAQAVLDKDGKETKKQERVPQIGVRPVVLLKPVTMGEAWGTAVGAPLRMVEQIASVISTKPQDAVGGPITIAKASQDAAEEGIYSILLMAASLSISLGIMNLLPIPPLDGGQMVVALVEMFRREKRLSIGLQHGLSMVGVFFVIALTLAAFAVDLGRQASSNAEELPAASSK